MSEKKKPKERRDFLFTASYAMGAVGVAARAGESGGFFRRGKERRTQTRGRGGGELIELLIVVELRK